MTAQTIKSYLLVANACAFFILLASQLFVNIPFTRPIYDVSAQVNSTPICVRVDSSAAYVYSVDLFNSSTISTYVGNAITAVAQWMSQVLGAPMAKCSLVTDQQLSCAQGNVVHEVGSAKKYFAVDSELCYWSAADVSARVRIYIEPDEIELFSKSNYFLFAILISFAISASSAIKLPQTNCCTCVKKTSSTTEMKVVGTKK